MFAMTRPDFDTYFMCIAQVVSARATCDRKRVGAVLVRENRILSTGYNGALSGCDHCDDHGHLIVDSHCVRVVHAETNAITHAARTGVPLDGASLYVTTIPCLPCFMLTAAYGIVRIAYNDLYGGECVWVPIARQLSIEVVRHRGERHEANDHRVG
jgi:dCMP deaminase